jgi:hypothetical protein
MEEQIEKPTKFKMGDLCTIRTSGETVMVIKYEVNSVGSLINHSLKEKRFPESVVTDNILCEGTIDKKFQRKFIKEANLELKEQS